jgi:hypothetical protein
VAGCVKCFHDDVFANLEGLSMRRGLGYRFAGSATKDREAVVFIQLQGVRADRRQGKRTSHTIAVLPPEWSQ